MAEALNGETLDAIVCVAGGWAGGNAAHADFITNSDMMWKQSVWSSIIASSIAAKHLKEGGLLSLTGAKPALEGKQFYCISYIMDLMDCRWTLV